MLNPANLFSTLWGGGGMRCQLIVGLEAEHGMISLVWDVEVFSFFSFFFFAMQCYSL